MTDSLSQPWWHRDLVEPESHKLDQARTHVLHLEHENQRLRLELAKANSDVQALREILGLQREREGSRHD
jgi:hypothetical protein